MKTVKKFTHTLFLFFVTGFLFLVFSAPVLAYEEDTHFQMTYVICRSVGFTADEAMTVAAVNQGMDDSDGVVATGGLGGAIPNVDEEWLWHALDGYGFISKGSMKASGILARRDALFDAALRAKDTQTKLKLLGVFFHYQQDTWGHRLHYDPSHLSRTNFKTYNTPLGHLRDMHSPDRPPFDPVAALMNLEDGVVYARTFLSTALGRQPGAFLANYQPQGGTQDSTWNRNSKYFHQISLAKAQKNSNREYLLSLIHAQVEVYTCTSSIPGKECTPGDVKFDDMRSALEGVCNAFLTVRSSRIPNPVINIPTKDEKVAAGYQDLTTPVVKSWFPESVMSKVVTQIASAINNDGSLEIFYVSGDGKLYHRRQTIRSVRLWGDQQLLADNVLQVAVQKNADGRLEVFYINTDNNIFHRWQNSPGSTEWHGAESLNIINAKQIATTADRSGRLYFFYIAINGDIKHRYQLTANGTNNWSNLFSVGAGPAKQMSVATNEKGRLEIFYIGTDNKIYHRWKTPNGNGLWFDQETLPGRAKQITTAMNRFGSIDFFYIDSGNGSVYTRSQTAPGKEWSGNNFTREEKQINAATNSTGMMYLFVSDNDGTFYKKQVFSDTWNPGKKQLGRPAKQIISTLNVDGRLEVFYIGTDNVLYHNWQLSTEDDTWNGEEAL